MPAATDGEIRQEGLREYILQATLNMISRHGIATTTYRMIASEAGVSLGAISHYFEGKQDLCYEAFTLFADNSVINFAKYFSGIESSDEAREAYIKLLISTAANAQETALGAELYSLALRNEEYRKIAENWTYRCRLIMSKYFDTATVAGLDAFYEGVILHRRMRFGEYTDDVIQTVVERITALPETE